MNGLSEISRSTAIRAPKPFACNFENGIGDLFDGFALFESRSEERMAAKIGERAAKLRLKDDDQSDGKKHRQAAQDPADHSEIKNCERKVRVRKRSASPMRMRAP